MVPGVVCSGLTSPPCFRSQSRKPTQLTAPKWRARCSSWKRSGHKKCFFKKVSFFSGRGQLPQQTWTVPNSQLFSMLETPWPGKFLFPVLPPPQVSGKVRVPNFGQPAMPDRGSSQLPRYLHVWQLPWVEAEAGGRVHARAARCQPDT